MSSQRVDWSLIADRLRPARNYWLGTSSVDGSPHAVPVWGVLLGNELILYGERRTVRARNIARDPRAVLHLDDAEDVVIVHGTLLDAGHPTGRPDVLAALNSKYDRLEDQTYLPSHDPDFDVLWSLVAARAMLWRLSDWAGSQQRWQA